MLLCYLLWGLLPIFWRQLSALHPLYVLSCRVVFSALFSIILIVATGQWRHFLDTLRQKREMLRLLCSGVAVGINWGLYIYAVNSGHVLDASLAYYLNPLFAIALGFLLFSERLTRLQWVSLLIVAGGIVFVLISYGTVPYFSLLIAISFALYGAIKKRVRASNLVSTCIESLLLFPPALIVLFFASDWGMAGAELLHGWQLIFLPLAGVVTSVPLLLFSFGIKRLSLSLSGMLMYINPTLQLILGIVLFGETLSVQMGILFVCVWVALILFMVSARKKKPVIAPTAPDTTDA